VRIDQAKLPGAIHDLRVQGGVAIGAAVLALIVTAVGASTALLMGLRPSDHLAVRLVGGGCLFFAGAILPGSGAIAALVFVIRSFRRAHAFEQVTVSVLHDGTLDRPALEARLGAAAAERTIADLIAKGLAAVGAATPARSIPAPPMPSPVAPASPQVHAGSAPYSPRIVVGSDLSLAPTSLATPSVRPPPAPDLGPMPATRSPGGSVRPPPAAPTPAMAPAPALTPSFTPSPQLLAAEPIADMTGRTLKSTWVVERRLASGGMGTVYAAHHARTGRRYALKTLLPDEQLSTHAIARFEREARAASAIGHAGIAAVHDFDRTPEGVHYLVMDLLEGETLETRLARVGRLSWDEARPLFLQVADALAAAHRAHVLHRDVKPSNVFLAAREGGERAMLVDFGLAKPLKPGQGHFVTRTGAIVGTAHYMAPEQARGEAVDERTDVYGLGALLYEMVAGVPPFLGASPFAVMAMLLSERPVAPSSLSPGLAPTVDALILRALSKAPDERFADVPSMIDAVRVA
jgi:serine/threonine-protein kinase